MAMPTIWSLILALTLTFSAGCSTDNGEEPGDPDGSILLDKGATPDNKVDPLPTSYKVAAVQYGSGDYSKQTQSCSDDLCGLSAYIRTAAKNKAKLVVVPEYSTGQKAYEPSPKIGDKPATDSRWASGSIIKTFAKLADELEITLVFNLITEDGSTRYNTNLAVDKEGEVVARHYKFQLFAGEASKYTPGPSVNTSFFDTPAGRAGMLICADAQCVVTGLKTSTDCSAHAVTQLQTFFGKKPDLVVFSALWTVGPSNPSWYSVAVQAQIATGAKVWVVGANTTEGAGYGGGIFDPTGKEVAVSKKPTPAIMYAEIPFKK
jgi:predicted amidohydrolase